MSDSKSDKPKTNDTKPQGAQKPAAVDAKTAEAGKDKSKSK